MNATCTPEYQSIQSELNQTNQELAAKVGECEKYRAELAALRWSVAAQADREKFADEVILMILAGLDNETAHAWHVWLEKNKPADVKP